MSNMDLDAIKRDFDNAVDWTHWQVQYGLLLITEVLKLQAERDILERIINGIHECLDSWDVDGADDAGRQMDPTERINLLGQRNVADREKADRGVPGVNFIINTSDARAEGYMIGLQEGLSRRHQP